MYMMSHFTHLSALTSKTQLTAQNLTELFLQPSDEGISVNKYFCLSNYFHNTFLE